MKSFVRLLLALAFSGVLFPVAPVSAAPPLLPAPANLHAQVVSVSGKPQVHLQWASPTPGFHYYFVLRDGRLACYTPALTYIDAFVSAGETHTYTVGVLSWPPSAPARVSITVPLPTPLAPTGLKAAGQWVTDCPKCRIAMAHVVLSWNAVAQATGYHVYRDGTLLPDSVTTPGDTDMSVASGHTYSYTVCAVSGAGSGPQTAAVLVTTPAPPVMTAPAPTLSAMGNFTAPTNLAAHGVWQGGPTDTLSWDAVPGAASYNVYQYDQLIAQGVTGTSFVVPLSRFNGSMTYTVTAVDGDCSCESLPSAIALAAGALDPTQKPDWTPDAPTPPTKVLAVPEWNAGAPRIRLAWCGASVDYTYSIYRDGVKIASGLSRLAYLDAAVRPGETHTYAVTGVNVPWTTPVESAQSAPVTATALAAAPNALAQKVQITQMVSNDDSVVVFFGAVPGAADYRVYDITKPGSVKYSGGGLSIEMNGLDPAHGADLVVEAVDKLGPFQKMDGSMGPGAMQMDGTVASAVNGQGDPSDVPVVLARSDSFHVTCQPQALTGAQSFFDDFRGSQPFAPSGDMDPVVAALSDAWTEINEVENDKWRVRTYGADTAMSKVFLMNNHLMDTLYDGPTAATHPFSHNNNASLVMMPKATADISGNKVLHVTFEVDGHFGSRRWCDVFVTAAGQPLLSAAPTKLGPGQALTPDGSDFYWQIQGQTDDAQFIHPQSPGSGSAVMADLFDLANGVGADDFGPGVRTTWNGIPVLNGTTQDLDRRHRFDLYLSQTRFRVEETAPGQPTVIVKDETFTNGLTLPFTRCQVYFVHELYHTGNDRPEQINYSGGTNAYWYNNRPWADERHWDNMGFEVLPGFPQ